MPRVDNAKQRITTNIVGLRPKIGRPTTKPGKIGMANPASVYAYQQGLPVTIINTSQGQQGIVTLPNGTTMDEWDYYRQRKKPKGPPIEGPPIKGFVLQDRIYQTQDRPRGKYKRPSDPLMDLFR